MSERKPNVLLPVIGAAIVVAGGVGVYFYTKGGLVKTPPTILGTAKVVPSKALMAASISADSKAWAKLDQFKTPESQKLFDNQIKEFQQQTLANSGVDFTQDIQPWAGNVMVAILPTSAATTQSQIPALPQVIPVVDGAIAPVQAQAQPKDPNVLLVVEVRDKVSAAKFAEKFKQKSGGKVAEKEYKGITISTYNNAAKSTNTALLGDYLVISPQDKSVEQAIDTFKGEASFATSIESSDIGLENPLLQFYMPNFADSIKQMAAMNPNAKEIPPESLEQLSQLKSLTMGIGVDNSGIRLKAIAKLDPNARSIEYKPSPGKVISQFPSETLALITGNDIKNRWIQFTKDAEKSPELKKGLENARNQLKNSPFALDLDKDIFGWMDGEFALGAIATTEGILAQVGAGPVFIFQTSDRPTAEATLKKLDEVAKQNQAVVSTKDIGGVSVTQWAPPGPPGSPEQEPLIGHGWYQQDTFFLTLGPLIKAMASKPANPLPDNQTFKAATNSLDKSNIGYFYLDMDKTWGLISSKMPPAEKSKITPEANALINTVLGIGVTTSVPDKSTGKLELLVALKPNATRK